MRKLANLVIASVTVLLLNGVWQHELVAAYSVENVTEGFRVLSNLDELLYQLDNVSSDGNIEVGAVIDFIHKVGSKVNEISDKIVANREIVAHFSELYQILIGGDLSELQEHTNEIKLRFDKMEAMSQSLDVYSSSMKKAFALWNVNPGPSSISSKLHDILFLYFGYQDIANKTGVALVDKLFVEFLYESSHNLCPTVTPQQYFLGDYIELKILQIKGYLINKFSWAILRSLEGKFFRGEEEELRHEYDKRSQHITNKLRNVISKAGRELRRCDPYEWKEKVNYEQLKRLIQGYIVNEVSFKQSTCVFDCKFYANTTINGCSETDTQYCPQDKAFGKILRCEFDSSRDEISLCPSKNPARRYEYFETNRGLDGSGRFYGERDSCPQEEILLKSWFSLFFKCSYCFCLLEDHSVNSEKFFNLREVLSDVDENKVVTGVRFVKRNRVMYLQIQQGELSQFGLIDKATTQWKELEDYELSRENEGVDYIKFDNEYKSISLGDVQTKNISHVVTGVKLSTLDDLLQLEVRVTLFDYREGKLINPDESSEWISNNLMNRNKLSLRNTKDGKGPNVSTRAQSKNVPSDSSYNVIEFTYSDKVDDASQTTLPFFDIQDVVSQSPTALSGVGFYHKGVKGYGGFIAPKILSIDLTSYI